LVGAAGNVHLTQAADRLAMQQTIAIDPQQLAQRSGITSIRLAFLPVVGLDQNHLVAAIVSQHANQPIVEATHFQHGHERLAIAQPLTRKSLQGLGVNAAVQLLGGANTVAAVPIVITDLTRRGYASQLTRLS
jgi:hypothetical protein